MVYRPMNLPQSIQAQYYRDPQLALANRLMVEGTSTAPVQHWAQGLGRLAQALAGTYINSKVDQQYQDRGKAYADTMSQALMQGQPQANLPGPNPDGSAGYTKPGDMTKMAAILAGNPDTAAMALPLSLQNIQYQQGRQDKMADTAEQRHWQRENQKSQFDFQKEMATINDNLLSGRMNQQQAFQAAQNALNRSTQLQIAQSGKVPLGYRQTDAGLEAIPGGPADPSVLDAATARKAAARKGNGGLPPTALKMQQEELDAIGTASSINSDLGQFSDLLASGKLDLGPVTNLFNQGRNMIGASTPESRSYGSFKSTLEKLRNDSLRLNKGVQTEGDAQRAWNELVSNINDPKLVQQRLGEIQRINERAAQLRKLNIDNIRSNYNLDPLDIGAYQGVAPAIQGSGPPAASGGGWSIQKVQ